VWLQWIANNQPLTPIIETVRSLLLGGPLDSGWLAAFWCVLIVIVSVVLTVVLFRAKSGKR
jgi:ABC-2 type transport system permease protein